MQLRFDGRLALITGGASGIGAACCKRIAEAGARVVVADRDEAAARALADTLRASAVVLDVAGEVSVEQGVAAV